MKVLSKASLIDELVERSARAVISKEVAAIVLDALADIVIANTDGGIAVRIPGLGTFSAKTTPARMGRNPKTGEPAAIAARRKLVFKASATTTVKE